MRSGIIGNVFLRKQESYFKLYLLEVWIIRY
jgi:hypothetical protein